MNCFQNASKYSTSILLLFILGKSVRFNLWIVIKEANKDLEQCGITTMMDLFFNIEIVIAYLLSATELSL